MSSHMPTPYLRVDENDYVDLDSTLCSVHSYDIPDRMPHTPNEVQLVDGMTSFPMNPTAPCYFVDHSHEETNLMRPFVPCDASWKPVGKDDFIVTAKRIALLQETEMRLAKHHGLETIDFAGAEEAERVLHEHCGIKVGIPKIDSADLLEQARERARLHFDAESKQAVDDLHELHHLRTKFWSFPRIPRYMIMPRWISGRPYRHPDTSHFWALLIGIDDYRSIPLRGAVSDALLMKEYLKKELRMPDTRIECLLSSVSGSSVRNAIFPSRRNIIRKLLILATDTQIGYGDNIIIFFSGHGTSYDLAEDPCSHPNGMLDVGGSRYLPCLIDALCPADRGNPDDQGIPIPDISDREINAILHQISLTKGHRITVILDCCHSGSMTRDVQEGVRRVAPLGSPEAMLIAADNDLSRYPGYQSVLSEDWRPDKSSHVTLAACREYQYAQEMEEKGAYNGVFTRSLVHTLNSGHCKKDTTYVDLIQALPLSPRQNPIVSGDRKRSLLWYRDQD